MARGSESKAPAFQTGDHAARDANCDCKGALRTRRGIARRDQAVASEEALGRRSCPIMREPPYLRPSAIRLQNPLPACESSLKFLFPWLLIQRNMRIRKHC